MRKKKTNCFRRDFLNLGFVFFFFILFLNNVVAVNVGVSPASVSFKGVLREGYAERNVLISVDSEDEVEIEIFPRGEILNWLNFSENKFMVSRNSPYALKISVVPPVDIPNGNYTGFVRIMTSSFGEGVEDYVVGVVKSSLDLAINVEVVDTEIINCMVSDLEILSSEEGDDILLLMNILNDGNIRLSPQISVDIWDQDQLGILKNVDFVENEILPTTKEKLTLRINSNDFDIAQYWAEVFVADCLFSETVTFDVLEKGTLSAKGVLLRILTRATGNVKETIPIEVGFKNTGEKEVSAQFKGKITKGSKVVEILESEKLNVPITETEKFTFYFTPTSAGEYSISGRVYYSGKKTFEASTEIKIFGGVSIFVPIVYTLLLFVVIFLFYKIRKERKIYFQKLKNLK